MKRIATIATMTLLLLTFLISCGETGPGEEFAKCVTDAGAVMYGAYWCPHCLNQKESFGDAWTYVNYIECSLPNRAGQTEECTDADIEGYPTWEFADGSRKGGEVPLTTLAELTGCSLPEGYSE
jgi:hypothetical protein